MSTKTTSNGTNGTTRKSLAEQIDRLDSILDNLGEGLNDAVAGAMQEAVGLAVRQAVEQAVRQGVQAAVAEVLSNPDVLALLRAAAPPATPTPSVPTGPSRLKKFASAAKNCAKATLQKLGQVAAAARSPLQLVAQFKVPLLLALSVGTVAGTAALYAGPWVAAGVAWLGGFTAALAAQAGLALKRVLAAVTAT